MAVRYKPTIPLVNAFDYEAYEPSTGIFYFMTTYGPPGVPWNSVEAQALDSEYFFNRSGQKKISPLVYNLLDAADDLDNLARDRLCMIILSRYQQNWWNLWRTYHDTDYDFLADVDITETGSNSETSSGTRSATTSLSKTGTDNLSDVHGHQKSTTDSLLHGEVVTTRDTGTQSNANSKYGFNSAEAVPTDEAEVTVSNVQTNEHNGTDARTISEGNSGTDQHNRTLNLSDSGSESGTDSKTGSGSFSKTRKGLSGAKSFQELIQSERNLWIEDFYERVFLDLDTVLVSPVYNRTHPVNPYSVYPFGYNQI